MIEVTDERAGLIFLNIDRIQRVQKYGGMTYIILDDGSDFKVVESYGEIKSMIDNVMDFCRDRKRGAK